jgi:hypothetical protein
MNIILEPQLEGSKTDSLNAFLTVIRYDDSTSGEGTIWSTKKLIMHPTYSVYAAQSVTTALSGKFPWKALEPAR